MKRKLEIRKVREFGEVIGDGFAYIGQNFGTTLKAFLLFVVPIYLVAFLLTTLISGDFVGSMFAISSGDPTDFESLKDNIISLYSGMGLFFLIASVASAVIYVIVFAGFEIYEQSEDGSISLSELTEKIKSNILYIWGSFFAFLFVIVLPFILLTGVLFGLLGFIFPGFITGLLAFAYFFFLMYLVIPLVFYMNVRYYERLDIFASAKRCFQLVKDNWWSTFGALIIIYVIVGIISYIFLIPFYIVLFTGVYSSGMGSPNMDIGIWGTLSMLLYLLGSALVSIYAFTSINFKYLSLVEAKEGVSLFSKIDSIGEQKDSAFENEGEF